MGNDGSEGWVIVMIAVYIVSPSHLL